MAIFSLFIGCLELGILGVHDLVLVFELCKELTPREVLGLGGGDELGVHAGHFLFDIGNGLALCFFVEVADGG